MGAAASPSSEGDPRRARTIGIFSAERHGVGFLGERVDVDVANLERSMRSDDLAELEVARPSRGDFLADLAIGYAGIGGAPTVSARMATRRLETPQETPSVGKIAWPRNNRFSPIAGDPSRGRKQIVIVGGGFAGITAARALKRCDADVLLIDRRNHHIFQRLLYQVATAILEPSEISAPLRHLARIQKTPVYCSPKWSAWTWRLDRSMRPPPGSASAKSLSTVSSSRRADSRAISAMTSLRPMPQVSGPGPMP